jgi:predicted enzyme related to lactoylglutathione lyase
MQTAKPFYAQLLPALGFTSGRPEHEWQTYYAMAEPADFLGFTEDPDHQPNGTRIAFWAETREEVDRLAELVRRAGARNIEGPELCIEYTPGYYAVFFEDPDGNKLEVCCRKKPGAAE